MTAQIALHRPISEKIIRHSLNNSLMVLDHLSENLIQKGYEFIRNHQIGNYKFDFYFPESKQAIEVDSYAHEFSEIYNQDTSKVLQIHSLGIKVIKLTDHQILIDIDEVFRLLKNPNTSITTNHVV